MKFLSILESAAWCKENAYPLEYSPVLNCSFPNVKDSRFKTIFKTIEYSSPGRSRQKVALAKIVFNLLGDWNEALVWCRGWEIFGAGLPLFARFRQAFGEQRDLFDSPGHLASRWEKDDATSILTMCQEYDWDCFVLTSGGKDLFFCSHDEYWSFGSVDPIRTEQFEDAIRSCNWD